MNHVIRDAPELGTTVPTVPLGSSEGNTPHRRSLSGLVAPILPLISRLLKGGVARNTLLLSANTAVVGAGGIVFWYIAARLYSQADVGLATAATSLLILASQVGLLGMGYGLIRFSRSLGNRRTAYMAVVFGVTAAACLVLSLPLGVLVPHIARGMAPVFSTWQTDGLFVVACLVWGISLQYDNYLMSREYMGLILLKNLLITVVRVVAIFALPGLSPAGLVAITGLSGLFGLFGVAPFVLLRPLPVDDAAAPAATFARFASYSLWNHVSSLSGIAPPLIVPTLVVQLASAGQAGAYYLDWALLTVLQMLPAALSWTLFAHGSSHGNLQSGFTASLRRHSDLAILALAVLFVPAGLLILYIFGRNYFLDGAVALLVMVAGIWPYHRALLHLAEMRLNGSQRFVAMAYAGSQAGFIVMSIPLLMLLGATGAALAWTGAQWLVLVALSQGSARVAPAVGGHP